MHISQDIVNRKLYVTVSQISEAIYDLIKIKKELQEFNSNLKSYANLTLENLGISEKLIRALNRNGIIFLDELLEITEKQLSLLSGIGKAGINNIMQALSQHNLRLREETKENGS